MTHYIIIVIINVIVCPLFLVIPLGLLYIPRRSSHLNHVIDLVYDVMYKEVFPSRWLIYSVLSFIRCGILILMFLPSWVIWSITFGIRARWF